MEWLTEKIKSVSLTEKERLVAEFFVNNFSSACFMTVTSVAREVGVSDSSVVRFARAIGFSSFNGMKVAMQKEMSKSIRENIEYARFSPAQRMEGAFRRLDQEDIARTVVEQAVPRINALLSQNSVDTFQAAADIIIASRRKYITGFRTALPVCEYLKVVLNCCVPNVILNTAADARAVETLLDISPDDCLVLCAFFRYGKMNMTACEIAKKRGAKVILITDKFTFPGASEADAVLVANSTGLSFFNSITPAMLLAEILCAVVSKKTEADTEERLEFINQYLTPERLY